MNGPSFGALLDRTLKDWGLVHEEESAKTYCARCGHHMDIHSIRTGKCWADDCSCPGLEVESTTEEATNSGAAAGTAAQKGKVRCDEPC